MYSISILNLYIIKIIKNVYFSFRGMELFNSYTFYFQIGSLLCAIDLDLKITILLMEIENDVKNFKYITSRIFIND